MSEEFKMEDALEQDVVPSNQPVSGNNVIVSYLPHSMSDQELYGIFSSVGPLKSFRSIHDKVTHQHLGYGFADYVLPEGAELACKRLNKLNLCGKLIKVSVARPRDGGLVGANLHIAGLPTSWTTTELDEHFSKFGEIVSSKVLYDRVNGVRKGVGFVRFDKRCQAEKAMEEIDGQYVDGASGPLLVSFARGPSSPTSKNSRARQNSRGSSELHGGSEDYGERLLPGLQPYGIQNGLQMQNGSIHWTPAEFQLPNMHESCAGQPGVFVGDGRVPQQAQLMPQNMELAASDGNQYFGGQSLFMPVSQLNGMFYLPVVPEYSQQPAQGYAQWPVACYPGSYQTGNYASNNMQENWMSANGRSAIQPFGGIPLHVGNLGKDTTENTLRTMFGKWGEVVSAKVIRSRSANSVRPYAFVNMRTHEQATTAICQLNGSKLGGREINVSFKHSA